MHLENLGTLARADAGHSAPDGRSPLAANRADLTVGSRTTAYQPEARVASRRRDLAFAPQAGLLDGRRAHG